MNHWQRGDIIVVAFPYMEPTGRVVVKGRPGLIVSSEWVNQNTADVIVAAISSRRPVQNYPTDFRIASGTPTFQRSGLRVTSIVKTAVVATIPQSVITRRLGSLTADEMRRIDRCLRAGLEL
jgi:mRNA-degrading endonuclease toxin of MazEF toxin-antitoxin module